MRRGLRPLNIFGEFLMLLLAAAPADAAADNYLLAAACWLLPIMKHILFAVVFDVVRNPVEDFLMNCSTITVNN